MSSKSAMGVRGDTSILTFGFLTVGEERRKVFFCWYPFFVLKKGDQETKSEKQGFPFSLSHSQFANEAG